jgi:hypothetical protein
MLINRLYVLKYILFYLNPNEAENIRYIRGFQISVRLIIIFVYTFTETRTPDKNYKGLILFFCNIKSFFFQFISAPCLWKLLGYYKAAVMHKALYEYRVWSQSE